MWFFQKRCARCVVSIVRTSASMAMAVVLEVSDNKLRAYQKKGGGENTFLVFRIEVVSNWRKLTGERWS